MRNNDNDNDNDNLLQGLEPITPDEGLPLEEVHKDTASMYASVKEDMSSLIDQVKASEFSAEEAHPLITKHFKKMLREKVAPAVSEAIIESKGFALVLIKEDNEGETYSMSQVALGGNINTMAEAVMGLAKTFSAILRNAMIEDMEADALSSDVETKARLKKRIIDLRAIATEGIVSICNDLNDAFDEAICKGVKLDHEMFKNGDFSGLEGNVRKMLNDSTDLQDPQSIHNLVGLMEWLTFRSTEGQWFPPMKKTLDLWNKQTKGNKD